MKTIATFLATILFSTAAHAEQDLIIDCQLTGFAYAWDKSGNRNRLVEATKNDNPIKLSFIFHNSKIILLGSNTVELKTINNNGNTMTLMNFTDNEIEIYTFVKDTKSLIYSKNVFSGVLNYSVSSIGFCE